MAAGALLLAGAAALTGSNLVRESRAGARSARTVAVLQEQIPGYPGPGGLLPGGLSAEAPGAAQSASAGPIVTQVQSMRIDGEEYIGVLDIPALSLCLPVQKDWSYPRLELSPCRYAGSFLDDTMIIAGHNYRGQFGGLHELRSGDSVRFTDVVGDVCDYQVVSVEKLSKTDVEQMQSGDWDLTLFTCTAGGADRVAVRCRRALAGLSVS